MRVHILKAWPEPFAAVVAGAKTYEVRKDDRGFAVGDYLRLDEWEPHGACWHDGHGWSETYEAERRQGHRGSGVQWCRVTYKTPGGSWGLPADVCVLGIEKCEEPTP